MSLPALIFSLAAAAAAKSLQSCLTLCDPIHGSPPGSPVPGILQARTLEWVAIAFSNAWKWKVKGKSYLTFRDPMDCSLPGSSTHGILHARVLEWGAIKSILPMHSSLSPSWIFNFLPWKWVTWLPFTKYNETLLELLKSHVKVWKVSLLDKVILIKFWISIYNKFPRSAPKVGGYCFRI